MSIYDQRETPAYRDVYRPYTHRCLEKIWTPDHDAMLKKLIAEWQWYWFWQVTDAVVAMTPLEVMHPFIEKSQNWRNNIMYFAQTHAHQLGYVKAICKPE
jgi:hypothetical protein